MEILDNGRLTVDGGDGTKSSKNKLVGGGAGGIIQIISPVGKITAGSLSLGHGTSPDSRNCGGQTTNAHGYYCLQGMSIQRSFMGLDNFLISSSAVPSISEPSYFHAG